MGYKTCYRCNGYGYIHCFHTDGYNPFCIRCEGRGRYECNVCKGTGKIYVADPERPKSSSGGNLILLCQIKTQPIDLAQIHIKLVKLIKLYKSKSCM